MNKEHFILKEDTRYDNFTETEQSPSAKKPLSALKYFTIAATSSMPTVFNEKHHRLFKIVCIKNYI